MENALSPSLKALFADKLIKHSDVDVKVALASCFNEIQESLHRMLLTMIPKWRL
jgi:hypothetical protein